MTLQNSESVLATVTCGQCQVVWASHLSLCHTVLPTQENTKIMASTSWGGTFLKLVRVILLDSCGSIHTWECYKSLSLQVFSAATSSTHTAITHRMDNPFGTSYRLWTASELQTMPQTMDGLRIVDHAPRIQWGLTTQSSQVMQYGATLGEMKSHKATTRTITNLSSTYLV